MSNKKKTQIQRIEQNEKDIQALMNLCNILVKNQNNIVESIFKDEEE